MHNAFEPVPTPDATRSLAVQGGTGGAPHGLSERGRAARRPPASALTCIHDLLLCGGRPALCTGKDGLALLRPSCL